MSRGAPADDSSRRRASSALASGLLRGDPGRRSGLLKRGGVNAASLEGMAAKVGVAVTWSTPTSERAAVIKRGERLPEDVLQPGVWPLASPASPDGVPPRGHLLLGLRPARVKQRCGQGVGAPRTGTG
jgi:hypothetical protein